MGCSASMNAISSVQLNTVNVKPLKSPTEEPSPSSTIDIIENSLLVWLTDQPVHQVTDYNTQLRRIISALKLFVDPNTCYSFLASIRDEIIFLIVSIKHEEFIKRVYHLTQIYKIYLFDQTTMTDLATAQNQNRQIDIFRNISSLCDELDVDRKLVELDSLTVVTINPSTPTGITTKRIGAFLIGQYLISVASRLKFDAEAKSMFVDFCRTYYADNEEQLRCIDDFDKNYRPKEALKWLTGNSFVARIFNRVQRIPDIDLMYKGAFLMKHTHIQLANFSDTMSLLLGDTPLTLYRGKTMSQDEFNEFMKDIDSSFLTCAGFFIGNTNKNVTVDLLRRIVTLHRERISVLFEIRIDATTGTKAPFALLESNGNDFGSQNNEFCFTLGTIFRIESIEKNHDFAIEIWIVKMIIVTNDSDPSLSRLIKEVRSDEAQASPALYLAKLFTDAGFLHRVEKHYFQLLQDKSLQDQPRRFANISRAAGNLLVMKNEFEKAVDYYEEALNNYLTVLKPDHPDLIPVYNALGRCYSKINKYSLALQNYEKAAELMQHNNCETIDQDAMTDLNNHINELRKLVKIN